ncbi:MAG: hypothetical protein WCO96_04610 [Actinomycetes bacterium]
MSVRLQLDGTENQHAQDRLVVAVALILGILSAIALPSLTYDSWAWMVWARELASFALDESGGPVMKPLPVILTAPLAPFGDLGPIAWMSLVRTSYLLTGWIGWRIGLRLGGPAAGAIAAVGLLALPGFFTTAVQGYSEPVFILLSLVAVLCLLDGRAGWALIALSAAGLLRSEEWPILLLVAAWAAATGRVGWKAAVTLAFAPVVIWVGIDWVASGDPMRSLNHAAGGRGRTPGEAIDHLIDDLGPLTVIGAAIASALAIRERNRAIGLMLATGVIWVALIIGKGLAGYPIGARYLIPGAALLMVCAAWGVARVLHTTLRPQLRLATGTLLVCVILSWGAASQFRETVRMASNQVKAGQALDHAIREAGGRKRLGSLSGPTVMANTPLMTELAWRLGVPLRKVTTVWKRHPNDQISAPAVIFIAPAGLTGRISPLPERFSVNRIGSASPWTIYSISDRRATGDRQARLPSRTSAP